MFAYCSNCGGKVEGRPRFCSNCATPLSGESVSAANASGDARAGKRRGRALVLGLIVAAISVLLVCAGAGLVLAT
jgi:uncharacterized membrane protein YvbJ